tara:strand:+ start:2001 stop:2309 length:309 start_codon:yes stop_codon:yes gene_type:complete
MRDRLKYISQIRKKKTRAYRIIKYPNIPLSINDIYVITTAGDRLDLLANQFYSDVRLWWIIATANRDIVRKDSLGLKPGLEIRIPSNINQILANFEDINKSF